MRARNLMKRDVEACMFTDTAEKAVGVMIRRNCGFVPVVDNFEDWHLMGVLTDRDLALFLGKTDRRASDVQIGEFFCRRVKTVFEDTPIHDVMTLMEKSQIHRVPVVDRGGKLMGVISLTDLANEASREKDIQYPPEISERQVAEIVESLSAMQ